MESVLGLVRHAGNDALFRAIEMSLLATLSGQPLHLHAEGLRGTGKTTIMRAVRQVLPRIRRVRGCLYNCDPDRPHCPVHRALSAEAVAELGEEWVPMPFLEISHSAKVGTVVGSIDLGRLVSPSDPAAALLPGTIPQAHRGIIFVDEINRLAETAPELADILLDVMGTRPGRVQIEETGLPAVELPVQVSVWAASNPDEDPGPLEEVRRQLSDRFDFAIYTDRPREAEAVEQILTLADCARVQPLESQAELWRTRLSLRERELGRVALAPEIRQGIAALYSRFDLESLRAVQAIQAGVRLVACLENRTDALWDDLLLVAPMALRHRVDAETIKKIAAHLAAPQEKSDLPAAAGAQRSRFPGFNLGGVVAEPPAAPPTEARRPSEPPPAREQAPPQAADRRPAGGEGWLRQKLSSLRQPRQTQPAPSGGLDRGGRGAPPQRLLDPEQHPPQAAPHRARPIGELRLEELIRTEEELGRP